MTPGHPEQSGWIRSSCWAHSPDMKPFFIFYSFYCQGKYHSTSQSESLKPPGAIYRFMCIHLHRWTQSWTRPEIDGCAALILSGRCERSPVYYSVNSQARLHNWGGERAAGMHADKKCACWIRSSYIHTSLALMSVISLPLLLPLAVLHRFTTAAAMLGYINSNRTGLRSP